MIVIAHISDLHISKDSFDEKVFMDAVTEINHLRPDMIILTGDITDNGYYKEYQQATKYLAMFDAPLFAVPGNHDARNLGYQTFEELIGEKSWKLTMDDDFTVMGIDSSSPDENSGHIGTPRVYDRSGYQRRRRRHYAKPQRREFPYCDRRAY